MESSGAGGAVGILILTLPDALQVASLIPSFVNLIPIVVRHHMRRIIPPVHSGNSDWSLVGVVFSSPQCCSRIFMRRLGRMFFCVTLDLTGIAEQVFRGEAACYRQFQLCERGDDPILVYPVILMQA